MTSRIIALATTLLLTCAATSANITAALDSLFLERYGGHASEPGGAVIVARGDSVLYERYFGMADLPSQTPVSAKTLFCLASVSKQFTVAGLLQLAEQGRIDIEAPSSRYLPYKAALWDTVTLADLAGHTSGIADTRDRSNRDSCIYATDATSVHFFDDVVATQFPPGTAYDYLNPSFLLLAKVIENVSGEEFTAYQRRHVFSPAGMTNALYFSPDSMPATAAHGYAPDGNGGWNEYDYGEETFYATRPDGCLYATARDILAWERALASGKVLGDSLLTRPTPRALASQTANSATISAAPTPGTASAGSSTPPPASPSKSTTPATTAVSRPTWPSAPRTTSASSSSKTATTATAGPWHAPSMPSSPANSDSALPSQSRIFCAFHFAD